MHEVKRDLASPSYTFLGICLKLCSIILGATYRHTPSMRCRCASETLAILMASSQLSIKWASYKMYVKACTNHRCPCFESRGSKNLRSPTTVVFLSVGVKGRGTHQAFLNYWLIVSSKPDFVNSWGASSENIFTSCKQVLCWWCYDGLLLVQ